MCAKLGEQQPRASGRATSSVTQVPPPLRLALEQRAAVVPLHEADVSSGSTAARRAMGDGRGARSCARRRRPTADVDLLSACVRSDIHDALPLPEPLGKLGQHLPLGAHTRAPSQPSDLRKQWNPSSRRGSATIYVDQRRSRWVRRCGRATRSRLGNDLARSIRAPRLHAGRQTEIDVRSAGFESRRLRGSGRA